jgi:hypothetical protein
MIVLLMLSDSKLKWRGQILGVLLTFEYTTVGKKIRFTRMFVAFKACVDGFLNGCRPFLGVDSTVLTGRWRGQLASTSAAPPRADS